jgi:uncharacterized lipoprotein YddW (UPF0748 family)
MKLKSVSWLALLFFPALLLGASSYAPVSVTPPAPPREFRGLWVSAVGESAWETNQTTAEQKAALIAILDRAKELNLNAVMFQVRPECDALYDSKIEPWSEFLTGRMGRPPEPYYDPLAFMIEQAHRRGLELHAWFNPYRALQFSTRSPVASNHVTKTHPQWVRRYGQNLWLDPGERDVQDYTLSVVMDVVKRYDVDGVVFDDYFYPYAEKGTFGRIVDFPDSATWKNYGPQSGLDRNEWRRENVNALVQRTYHSIKEARPWVKFGVSPFGIWRPGYPPQIKGLDAYGTLYADSRKWLQNGWVDYLAPQLYWPVDDREHSFPVLLHWWAEQNVKGRHLWPGLNTYKVMDDWDADEIVDQIKAVRREPGASGEIHWNSKAFMADRSLVQVLMSTCYAQPALIPASTWLGGGPPQRPTLSVSRDGDLNWAAAPGDKPWLWVLQLRYGNTWHTSILTVARTTLSGAPPDTIAVSAVDRNGNLGPAATVGRMVEPPPGPSAGSLPIHRGGD